jgi:hypothetical protein
MQVSEQEITVNDHRITNLKGLCTKAADSLIYDLHDAGLGVDQEKAGLFKQCVNKHIKKLEELHNGGLPNRNYAKEELHNYLIVLNSIITNGNNYISNYKDSISGVESEDERKQAGRSILNAVIKDMGKSLEFATAAEQERRKNLGFAAKENFPKGRINQNHNGSRSLN